MCARATLIVAKHELAEDGAHERYGAVADGAGGTVRPRLEHELAVIVRMGLADYFLIVWDLVRHARREALLCQGRGSAVGSLVCYCLGITAVEPLAHGLSFERFLDPSRADPPDIDIDLPADRGDDRPGRERVIQYALSRYSGHAALVSTAVTFRARSAVRDVGMALGLAPAQIDALARAQERVAAGASGPDVGAAMLDLPPGRVWDKLRELCARLEGLPRHRGQHPGGVVVTARPLAEVAPIERARMPGRLVVQWDKDAAEVAGLVKIDLLGLGMLTVIDVCFDHIAARTGIRPALHGVHCDDPRVYDAFCAADTVGVFQLESRAQMTACLPRLQPRTLDDLTAAVALIRPGPLQGNATHPYLRRRQGRESVRYPGGEAGRRLRRSSELARLSAGTPVEVAGQVVTRERPGTARGVTFLCLSDEEGLINAVVPPAVYTRDRRAIRGEALLWVRGVVERRDTDRAVAIRVTAIRPLAQLLAEAGA